MASDNIELDAGTGGAVVRTDDDGTAHWQYVKLAFGADNTQNIVGSISSNPLPVALSATDNAVLDAIDTNTDFGAQTGGGTESGVLRVTIANNSTGVVSVDDNGSALTVDNAGTFAVQEDGAALTALQLIDDIVQTEDAAHGSGDNGIMPFGVRNDTLATLADTDGDYAPLQVNASGALYVAETGTVTVDATGQGDVPITLSGEAVTLAASDGTDIGDVDVASIAAGSNLIGDVGLQGRTSGGLTIFYDADLDEAPIAVKAGAGQIYSMAIFNTTDAPLYLQLFNVAQGSVTVGTTTPTQQYVIPGNANSDGAGFVVSIPQGIEYGTAITAAVTTDSEGSSAPGAGACIANILYE